MQLREGRIADDRRVAIAIEVVLELSFRVAAVGDVAVTLQPTAEPCSRRHWRLVLLVTKQHADCRADRPQELTGEGGGSVSPGMERESQNTPMLGAFRPYVRTSAGLDVRPTHELLDRISAAIISAS